MDEKEIYQQIKEIRRSLELIARGVSYLLSLKAFDEGTDEETQINKKKPKLSSKHNFLNSLPKNIKITPAQGKPYIG